jgi:hypothetical protein
MRAAGGVVSVHTSTRNPGLMVRPASGRGWDLDAGEMGFLRWHATVGQAIAAKVKAPPITVQDLRLTTTVVPIIDVDCIALSADVQGSSRCP